MVGQVLKNAVEAARTRSFINQIPDETISQTPGGNILVKAADPDDLAALNKVLEKGGLQGGLDLGRIGSIFEIPFEDMSSGLYLETILKNLKESNAPLFTKLKRDKLSMEQMRVLAEQTGSDELVYKFLNRKPGDAVPPEDILAGILASIKLGREIKSGAAKARYLPVEERAEAHAKLGVLVSVNANLLGQVSGGVSEAARGLAVVRHINKLENFDVKAVSEEMNSLANSLDPSLVETQLAIMASLEKPSARIKFAEEGFLAKSHDVAMEAYINALLSSPVTHMVNVAGNGSFQLLRLFERGLAGVVGNVRTLGGMRDEIGGSIGDQAYLGDALAEAHGMVSSLKDAITLMANTFVTGESSDLMSKIDLQNRRAIGQNDNVADVARNLANGEFYQSAIDTLGIATRLPGRFLASEDEFFKVITGRRVLYREAYRAKQVAMQTSLLAGDSPEQARQLAQDAYVNMMTNPPTNISEMMVAEGRELAFQGTPKGPLGKLAPYLRDQPGLKLIIPFYNTPTNVINEVFDRTLNFSTVYRAIKKGSGQEFDDAVAKLALGNAIAMGMFFLASGELGDGVQINGSGGDYKTRKVTGGANVPQYSIGKKQDDGSYKYYTFSRFDPISSMLAMGADMAEYVKYEDDASVVEAMARSYIFSIAEYAGNMPFLQGMSELFRSASNPGGTPEDKFERMFGYLGGLSATAMTNVSGQLETITNPFGATAYAYEFLSGDKYPIVGQTSFKAGIERLQDPTIRNTMLPEVSAPFAGRPYTELNPFMQGFYKKLQSAKARNPYYSSDLPPRLDFWANPLTAGSGAISEFYNPIRIMEGGYNDLDEEITDLARRGHGTLSLHPSRINGIQLNAKQYNDYVETINLIDQNGNMPDDDLYDPSQTLLMTLNNTLTSDAYKELLYGEDRFNELNNDLLSKRALARKYMTTLHPNLQQLSLD
jgi:hypothetical protein